MRAVTRLVTPGSPGGRFRHRPPGLLANACHRRASAEGGWALVLRCAPQHGPVVDDGAVTIT
jgi:hypothetical protein